MPTAIGTDFTPQKPKRKYDFKSLNGTDVTDGRVWQLAKGSDYTCSESNIREHAKRFADEENLDVDVRTARQDNNVVGVEIRFTPKHAGAVQPQPGA